MTPTTVQLHVDMIRLSIFLQNLVLTDFNDLNHERRITTDAIDKLLKIFQEDPAKVEYEYRTWLDDNTVKNDLNGLRVEMDATGELVATRLERLAEDLRKESRLVKKHRDNDTILKTYNA